MKILHIIPRYSTGGAERLVLSYAKKLHSSDREFYVASCVEGGELLKEFEDTGAGVHVSSRKKHGGRIGAWRDLLVYANSLQPDVIHSHLLSSDFFAYRIKKRAHWPVSWVVTLHNTEERTSLVRKMLWRFLLKRADKVVAVSESVYKFALNHFEVPKQKLVLLKNGIELEPYEKISLPRVGKTLRLATIGRLEEQKGHIELLRALAKFDKSDWRLDVFGEGSLENKLKAKSKKLKIDKKITWHGVVDDIPRRLAKVDMVIQPSLWEGRSLVVMEVMAAGRILLVSKAAGEGLVKNMVNGIVLENGNQDAIVDALEWIVDNSEKALKLAVNAREQAKSFDQDKSLQGVLNVYDLQSS